MRQMTQFIWIAHHVHRPDDIILNLERRRLYRTFRCVDDHTRQTIDQCKPSGEVFAPPLTRARTRDVNEKMRGALSALDYLMRRPNLAAAIGHDTNVAGKHLHQCIDIA